MPLEEHPHQTALTLHLTSAVSSLRRTLAVRRRITSTDRLLFPAASIGSVPQPDFVKDLIADEELLEFQMGHIPFSVDDLLALDESTLRTVGRVNPTVG